MLHNQPSILEIFEKFLADLYPAEKETFAAAIDLSAVSQTSQPRVLLIRSAKATEIKAQDLKYDGHDTEASTQVRRNSRSQYCERRAIK